LSFVARLALPLLQRLDAERAHRLTIRGLQTGLAGNAQGADDPCLATTLFGRRLANPVGLAAGFDKNAEVPDAMLRLGFGFVEIGSVTPRPQEGSSKPRLFRLAEDQAVINRMGFNNDGMARVRQRLAARTHRPGLVGVNLGANKDSADRAGDYALGLEALGPHAGYIVVNVSSPNTPGLRALQSRDELDGLLARLYEARAAAGLNVPVALKIAPDLNEADRADVADVALTRGLDALIVSNTTIARPASLRGAAKGEAGGLSGKPLFEPSTAILADMHRLTGGKLPLIGVGGIASGADAYAKIRAGASAVQLYSALSFHGPALIGAIKRDLAALLARDGFASVADAVGRG